MGEGLVCPISKEGNKLQCTYHSGINLLNMTYKSVSSITVKRLNAHTKVITEKYQCGLQSNRSKIGLNICYEANHGKMLQVKHRLGHDIY